MWVILLSCACVCVRARAIVCGFVGFTIDNNKGLNNEPFSDREELMKSSRLAVHVWRLRTKQLTLSNWYSIKDSELSLLRVSSQALSVTLSAGRYDNNP